MAMLYFPPSSNQPKKRKLPTRTVQSALDGDDSDTQNTVYSGEACRTTDDSPGRKSVPPENNGPPTTITPPIPATTTARKRPRLAKRVTEWPQMLHELERTHKTLNMVYTFCSTRRQLATTFDTLRPMVEEHTGRPFTALDVASMAAIRPQSIRFEYVDAAVLHATLRGAELEASYGTGPVPGEQDPGRSLEQEVLYFEFVDAEVGKSKHTQGSNRVQSSDGTSNAENIGHQRGPGGTRAKAPAFSQKKMMSVIQRRDKKFRESIDAFLGQCLVEGRSPEQALSEAARIHLPTRIPPQDGDGTSPNPRSIATLPSTIPDTRSSIADIVDELTKSEWYCGQIVTDGRRILEARESNYGNLSFQPSQDLANALSNVGGVTRFYSHQAEAINHLHAGHDVVVATPTSSGKSLIYQLPVLHALQEDPETRAIFVFPTKALAQDQMRSLQRLLANLPGLDGVAIATFDGDTPLAARDSIRTSVRVIFTNPDMLHVSILPQEERWRTFLQKLRFVAVDELHSYCGLFGAHAAFIMRRLRRLCAALGNGSIRFVSCSATIANPEQHFRTIFGVDDVRLVGEDGSPSGPKEFICWNTPYRDPGDARSGRASARLESARLFCQLILRGVRTIAFCRSRAKCESLVGAVKQELKQLGREEATGRVMGYRAGYTAQDRRMIERQMFDGLLLGIVATTALELGVDIGSLDCVLMWGFPYSIANLRQQMGRAGRRSGKDSLAILVGDGFATDQHYMEHPQELFSKPNGALHIDLDNVLVREGHVQCAAAEMPIRLGEDERYLGQGLERLCRERLVADEQGYFHPHPRLGNSPSRVVDIRHAGTEEQLAIVDTTGGRNEVLEELEMSRANFTVYEGGIFLHQGNQYLVRDFQPERHLARVERVHVDWTTAPRDYTAMTPTQTEAVRSIEGTQTRAYYGTIKIEQRVFGFFRKDQRGRILDAVDVDNEPVVRYCKGMWLDVPEATLDLLARRDLLAAAAIHAAEHAVMSLIPTRVASSMAGDVGTECKDITKELPTREPTPRKRPGRLFFYDAKGGAGGSGITTRAFEFIDVLLRQALGRISNCGCGRGQGCLECVAAENCCRSNEVVSRVGGMVVLMGLLGLVVDEDGFPMGLEGGSPRGDGGGGLGGEDGGSAARSVVVCGVTV